MHYVPSLNSCIACVYFEELAVLGICCEFQAYLFRACDLMDGMTKANILL